MALGSKMLEQVNTHKNLRTRLGIPSVLTSPTVTTLIIDPTVCDYGLCTGSLCVFGYEGEASRQEMSGILHHSGYGAQNQIISSDNSNHDSLEGHSGTLPIRFCLKK